MRVSICIATCKRPATLARLLDGLEALRLARQRPSIRVVVVDNDAAGSSRDVCERRAAGRWPLDYRIEPRRGIPTARNAAVAACCDNSDAIAFIDDDEVPHADWLEQLLEARARYAADIVAGPALPEFEEPPPQWAVDGAFFSLPRYETGSQRDRAFTNNVLVDCSVFRSLNGWFDERLRFTGGSDTHFFRRAHLAGFRIIWCDEAVVHDYVPATRVTRPWLVQRAYRYGHTHAFVRRDLRQDTRSRLALTAILRVRQVAASAVAGVVRRQQWRLIEAVTEAAYTVGMLANLAGFEYEEYRAKGGR